MSDLQDLKARIDLRLIVEADLGPAHCRGGKALLWRCPFHGEQKGCSLAVWANGWKCFGACGTAGDVLDWLQLYRNLTFIEACAYIGAEQSLNQNRVRVHAQRYEKQVLPEMPPPTSEWQNAAKCIVDQAESALWSPAGKRAIDYLKNRGLTEQTILKAHLGYIPGRPIDWLRLDTLTVPCGITIPWFVGQELWAVKVRRSAGQPKYTQIRSGSAHGLYNAANLEGHTTLLFVEGEFDTLLAEQECDRLVGVTTLGSASVLLNARWLPLLASAKTILVAYDADKAGMKGAARLQALTKRARVIQVPWGKDITEFVLQGGSVKQWLSETL